MSKLKFFTDLLNPPPDAPPSKPTRLNRHDAFRTLPELDKREQTERPPLAAKVRKAEAEVARLEGSLQDARAALSLAKSALTQFDDSIYHQRTQCRCVIESSAPACIAESLEFVHAISAKYADLALLGTVKTYTLHDTMPARAAPSASFPDGRPRDPEALAKWAETAGTSLRRDPFFGEPITISGQVLNGAELSEAEAEINNAAVALLALRTQNLPPAEVEERCASILEPLRKYVHLL